MINPNGSAKRLPEILNILTRILSKTHTKIGLNLIHFIDQDLRQVFIDGISKHHENLDGSGYPDGLTESEIPYVARVIRVVETFISLTTKRN